MLLEQYRALARYNRWMNEKIYGLCSTLSDGERTRDRGAFFSSIDGTLHHLLIADRIWMLRFTGDRERFGPRDAHGVSVPATTHDNSPYARFDDLQAERTHLDGDILAWVGQLDPAGLAVPFQYTTLAGHQKVEPLWWAVGHFFNHQTHHRGQVTTLLMQAGHDPKVTDLIAMLWGEAATRQT